MMEQRLHWDFQVLSHVKGDLNMRELIYSEGGWWFDSPVIEIEDEDLHEAALGDL